MTAGIQNLVIEQGATFTKVLTWKDSANVAIDLTAYTARMQARATIAAATTIFSLTSSPAAGITLGGAAGTITITLTATETAAITADTAYYDIELEDGSGVVTRLLQGEIEFSKEVTR